jgi:hypothetical protein
MIKFSIKASLYIFLSVNLLQPVSAQTCIKGDCKNGFGVLRVGSGSSFSYHIGNFNKKGKLEGKSVLMSWSYYNLSKEADFLFALSQEIPPIEKLWDFKPSFIKTGNFVNGLLEGPGVMLMNDIDYFPSIAWIPEKWFKDVNLRYIKYEGDFINSGSQKAGVVTFMYPNDTLICASDDLYQNNLYKSAEMVIDIRRKNALQNQLIRATFINKKMHGWAVKSERKSGNNQPSFFRLLWCYGKLIHEDNGGAYPFDMDDPQTIKDESGREITGTVRNGKVNGFGKIKYGYNNQYQGYLKDNRPDGYGFMVDTTGAIKYGLFNNGSFEQGSWMSYCNNRFIVTEGKKDNFKEGYLKESTYESLEDYLSGRPARWSFEGYKIQATGWQGKVLSTDYNTKTEAWFDKGVRTSYSSEINNIMVWEVYVKDGIASMLMSYDASAREGTLSDGRKINASNKSEYKPSSKYNSSHFFGLCTCGGDAKTTRTAEVSGYTKSWTRTEQVNKSAVVGYWQGTQQVTSTYYTPGYTITTKVACSNPNAVWAPYGVTTRHSVLRTTSLKE